MLCKTRWEYEIYDLPNTAEKVLRALRAERQQWSDGVMGN
jgi:hypothetical protein